MFLEQLERAMEIVSPDDQCHLICYVFRALAFSIAVPLLTIAATFVFYYVPMVCVLECASQLFSGAKRLDKDASIASLKRVDNDEQECLCCNGTDGIRLQMRCGCQYSVMHENCLREWLDKNGRFSQCPTCKQTWLYSLLQEHPWFQDDEEDEDEE